MPDRLASLDDPCYAASVHPDGVGSIVPGENNTVGTEAVIVETGGGNDKLNRRNTTSTDRGRSNVAASDFLLPSLQTDLATRPPGECYEAALYADRSYNLATTTV